jgi:hypothetical protein
MGKKAFFKTFCRNGWFDVNILHVAVLRSTITLINDENSKTIFVHTPSICRR